VQPMRLPGSEDSQLQLVREGEAQDGPPLIPRYHHKN